jgi:hypothetical protein
MNSYTIVRKYNPPIKRVFMLQTNLFYLNTEKKGAVHEQ